MRRNTLLFTFLSFILLLSLGASPTFAQYTTVIASQITHQATPYYEIEANTTDGGKVIVRFQWQKTLEWFGYTQVFNTPPILTISKFNSDSTLNYSITYMPFYVLQYNDTNANGVFDLGLRDPTSWGEDYSTLTHHEAIHSLYPMIPIFPWTRGGDAWNWSVSRLDETLVWVDDLTTQAYSWNISATLPSFPWEWTWGWEETPDSSLTVQFGYHLTFYPTGPEVKLDFNFSGITWFKPAAKLALKSIIIYSGESAPIVTADDCSWKDFNRTTPLFGSQLTITEEVEEEVLAWAITYENATVDQPDNIQPIEWTIHPVFKLPIGLYPHGTYFEGIAPEGTYMTGFAHQLGLPHFEKHVSQDPIIGLAAPLHTVTLPLSSGTLLSVTTIITAVIISTAAFTVLYKKGRQFNP